MFKILIVDDEFIIRTGIRTSIDWESIGMMIVGEASNGKEAYEKVMSLKPDIVITDIRMPGMDGLEFTKLLKESMPKVRIVIISGYNDFKYAREALRMGVNEYLLKPIGADELIKIMLKQCEEIVRELEVIDRDTRLKSLFRENLLLIQTRFVNLVVKGERNDLQSIIEKSRELNVDLSGEEYQVVIIDIDDFFLLTENLSDREKEQFKILIKDISEEILRPSTNSMVCFSEFDYLLAIINVKASNKHNLHKIYEEIQYSVKEQQRLTVTMGVSNIYTSILDIPKAHNEALFALRNKVFKGKAKIISINDVDKTNITPQIIYPSSDEKEIINYLKIMEAEKLNEVLEKLYTNLIYTKASFDEIKNICLRLITIAVSQLDEIGVDFRKYNSKQFDPYVEIEKYETVEDIKSWMKSVFQAFIESMMNNKNEKYKGIVKVAMQYMNEHYREDIGVDYISAITYVTPNYFSRVFKKETGKSFTEYLNMLRIEKAKLLLKDLKLRVYEVSEEVGYNDYKIFTLNFKKYIGSTPKEYRENILQK
jgi:two-component system, response regulator YesN